MKLVVTIREILQANGVDVNGSPYSNVCDYPFDTGDFFAVKEIDPYRPNFAMFADYERELATLLADEQVKMATLIAKINESKEPDEIRKLRVQKKSRPRPLMSASARIIT
ncbi:MAG: hypothetical protein FWB98_08150 [Defluviitaleaceae bacterium]|nr:hypothetical protein [Defluviitaleaceae bacterium]